MTIKMSTVRVEKARDKIFLSQSLSLNLSLLISIRLEFLTVCKIFIDANIYTQARVSNLKQLESCALSMATLPQGMHTSNIAYSLVHVHMYLSPSCKKFIILD